MKEINAQVILFYNVISALAGVVKEQKDLEISNDL
jgi:hypothetical protein